MNIKIILCLIGVFIAAFPFHAFGDGACCNPNGSCSINYNEGDCEEAEGSIWQGEGTTCDPNPCQQPVAVTSVPTMTEWGMIIFMVLAGLGSVYYLRRQRRA
jgi:hypothetical protein